MFFQEEQEGHVRESLIEKIFPKELLKVLYYHACRYDIEDNNDKEEIVSELLGPEFQEVGAGTNRIAYVYSPGPDRKFKGGAGLIYIVAIDRRGFIDNFTEFKRSRELPESIIKCYECNLLILVEEYVNLMDEEEFRLNENGIKEVLEKLDKAGYIFEDIGYTTKNYENWGYRENGDIVILDAGYIYHIKGNERALSCPKCSGQLKHNSNFTGFVCQNPQCRTKYNFIDVRRRMTQDLENLEDQMIMEAQHCEIPDFDRLNLNYK